LADRVTLFFKIGYDFDKPRQISSYSTFGSIEFVRNVSIIFLQSRTR
jgi:hypothetical protein